MKVKEYNIKNINGNVLTDQSYVNNRWSEYFRQLLNVEMEEDEQMEGEEEEEKEDILMMEMLETVLGKIKNGNVPGIDNIPKEIIRGGIKQKILEVPRMKLCKCLKKFAVRGRLKRAIESLYKTSTCTVRTKYENKIWFDVKTGVEKRSMLSPFLFIAYVDRII